MNLITLTGQVEYVMSWHEESRNSDMVLAYTLWKRFCPQFIHEEKIHDGATYSIGKEFVFLKDLVELPRESEIGRIRRVIQNDQHKYLPTSWEVAEARGIKEEEWRKHLGYPPKVIHKI